MLEVLDIVGLVCECDVFDPSMVVHVGDWWKGLVSTNELHRIKELTRSGYLPYHYRDIVTSLDDNIIV
eukprot:1392723-Amorphochlora_amoeboformis.AAC.1